MLSKKFSNGNKGTFKYVIGYISSFCIILLYMKRSQKNAYVKYFDKNNQYINLLLHDEELSKECNEIWGKIKTLFKKEFDSEPVYNDKYIKTKMCFNT